MYDVVSQLESVIEMAPRRGVGYGYAMTGYRVWDLGLRSEDYGRQSRVEMARMTWRDDGHLCDDDSIG